MRAKKYVWSSLVCLITFMGCTVRKEESNLPKSSSAQFSVFVDDYFEALFATNPSLGTGIGFHQYDSKLENLSAASVQQRIQSLKALLSRLEALRAGQLAQDEAIDAEILNGQILSELQELEILQSWKKNPMIYVGLPGGAIDALIKRDFAPPAERLKSVISRLKAIPAILEAMRQNVENPPKEFTDLAIRVSGGSVGFFKETLAQWAKEAAGNDTTALKEFEQTNRAVIEAMAQSNEWLRKELAPKSKGNYAIGSENFSKKLLYEDLVDIPLDRILSIGEANLKRDYEAFLEAAGKINPSKSPAAVMKSVSNDHPNEKELIPFAKRTVESIRQFLIDKKIVSIPSEVRPTIMETPPYARSGGYASMDTPGAYETKATEAFYYVTPVEKEWDAKHKEEHLRLFNGPVMNLITIHEAYPGHYIQFLFAKQFPTKTRKMVSCGTNVEGWAHYTEQMMLEEGFGKDDPKIRLAQLSEALLRDCRYIVGIKLHTQEMTVEQGAKIFIEKGFAEPAVAYEEARRGAYNPTYLYYTLGKLQILKLRDDYRKALGSAYSLQKFHDSFVKQGGIPVKLVRKILLPDDKESVL